jgi:hypothetical protein
MLAEAGLKTLVPKSFVFDFASPLEDYQIEYLRGWLSHDLADPSRKELLTSQDVSTLEQLLNPSSPHSIFARDDLHGIIVDTIYGGLK